MIKTASGITVVFMALVILFSCKNSGDSKKVSSEGNELSSSEKVTAKNEIAARVDEIFNGLNVLNVDAALKPYSKEKDFKIVNADATVTDYQTMRKTQLEGFKTLDSLNFKTSKHDFMFLEKGLVMCTWTGSAEVKTKEGKKLKIEPYVASMLFRERNNEWYIIYQHESFAPPVSIN